MSHIGWLKDQQRLANTGEHKRKKKQMSMFAQPSAPSGGIKWEDVKGKLLLIEPLSNETGINTSFGLADAVKANVTVLEADGSGERRDETLIFPKILASQVRSQIGQKVLGRLTQGTAKPGQSAPWMLDSATPSDIATAEAWVAKQSTPSVTSAVAPF